MESVDLLLFAGQSNMAGRGCAADAPLCPPEAGWEYRPISAPGRRFPIEEPFGRHENLAGAIDDGVKKTGSMVSAFVSAYHRLTGRKVVAVSASKGGTSSQEWADTLAADAASRLKSACSHLHSTGVTPERIIVLFCQGETDGDLAVSAAQYRKNFESIWAQLREAGAQYCGLIQIGHFNKQAYPEGLYGLSGEALDAQYEVIRCEQLRIAAEMDAVFWAGSFAEQFDSMKDEFHYFQQAYNEVGTKVAEKTIRHIQESALV